MVIPRQFHKDLHLGFDPGAQAAFQKIYEPIRRHFARNFLAFVCGERSLAEFDAFLAEAEGMGLREAMAIVGKAYAAWSSKPSLAR